jgi:hypothetical protein
MHEKAGDIWHEDEERYWGGPLPKRGEGWTLAAATYDGVPKWQPGWEDIGKAAGALAMLQEIPDHQPDWDLLLKDLRHLNALKDLPMSKPPLNEFGDFLLIGDFFLPFESQNEWGPRQLLYILEDQPTLTDPLLAEFRQLTDRLRRYPPLEAYVEHM